MLPQWFTKPEVIYTTVLFVIGILASVYPAPIRAMLATPWKSLNRQMSRSALRFYENELATLNNINGDSYQLVLWLTWNVINLASYAFWLLIFSSAVNLAEYWLTGKLLWTSFFTGLGSPIIGGIIGRGRRMYGVITALYDYEASTKKLNEMITSIKSQINGTLS